MWSDVGMLKIINMLGWHTDEWISEFRSLVY